MNHANLQVITKQMHFDTCASFTSSFQMETYCVMALPLRMAVLQLAASPRVVATKTSNLKIPNIVQKQKKCAVTVVTHVPLEVSTIIKDALSEILKEMDP